MITSHANYGLRVERCGRDDRAANVRAHPLCRAMIERVRRTGLPIRLRNDAGEAVAVLYALSADVRGSTGTLCS
jgi:hypothetical protein